MPRPPDAPRSLVLRRRAQLILVALLFLGPLALAFWAYYGVALRPTGRVNHGTLITPARPLPDVALSTPGGASTSLTLLHGKWTLLYIAADGCGSRCGAALADTRAVRLALGADTTRVQRVLLVDAPCCGQSVVAGAGPEVALAWMRGAAATRLLASFPEYGMSVEAAGRIYLVDPNGNLLMSYVEGAAPNGMLRDLERLLGLSTIG
jgi:cytochrome oxidase Cu insertion factor (SCO1/SenC/PrrC family)